jgi:hypothetical protein
MGQENCLAVVLKDGRIHAIGARALAGRLLGVGLALVDVDALAGALLNLELGADLRDALVRVPEEQSIEKKERKKSERRGDRVVSIA